MATKCISKLARSWPPSASLNSLDYSLQVHLLVRRSQPPNASPKLPNRCLQVHVWVQLDLGLQLHLWVSRSQRPNVAPQLLDYCFQVHLCVLLDDGLLVHLGVSRSRPPNKSPNPLDRRLSLHCWDQLDPRPPSASRSSLDRGLQVSFPVHLITASMCISKLSQSASPGAPAITLQFHLHSDWPFVYIYRDYDRQYMPFYDVVNLVSVTKMNLIHAMPCGHGTASTTAGWLWH